MKKSFSYFSTKIYVVGTQKNRLNETVLFSTQTYVKMDGLENIYNCTLNDFVHLYLPILLVSFITMIACEDEMLDNQSGDVRAQDSDGNPVPNVLQPGTPGFPFPANQSLSLIFDEEQNVTNVTIKVSPNAPGATIHYTDEDGNNVSKKIQYSTQHAMVQINTFFLG